MSQNCLALTTITGSTSEVQINSGATRLIAIIPQGTASGTVTVREANVTGSGNAARWTVPAGGTTFTPGDSGVAFSGGLTVQQSNSADTFGVIWGPRLV